MRKSVWMHISLGAVVAAALAVSCSFAAPEQFVNANGYWEVTYTDVTFQWKVVGVDLEVILSAPTAGWVAVGFDPTTRMKDANIIIGYVSGGVATVRDDYAHLATDHQADTAAGAGGVDNLTAVSGTESGGVTEIRFTIPLNSGDIRDRPLTQGNPHKVILAYGAKDNFVLKHAKRGSMTITL